MVESLQAPGEWHPLYSMLEQKTAYSTPDRPEGYGDNRGATDAGSPPRRSDRGMRNCDNCARPPTSRNCRPKKRPICPPPRRSSECLASLPFNVANRVGIKALRALPPARAADRVATSGKLGCSAGYKRAIDELVEQAT